MAETGSEGLQPPPKPGLVDKVVGALRGAAKAFEINTKPVPIEEIKTARIAQLIDTEIYNPLLERTGGDRFRNGFDMNTVLAHLNYPATWTGEDLSVKHPEAYNATRIALSELMKRGVIGVARDEETTDITRYFVINEAKLKEIVGKSKQSK